MELSAPGGDPAPRGNRKVRPGRARRAVEGESERVTGDDREKTAPSRETETAAELRLTVLGTRGSMAVSRRDCMVFGGSTSCYLVQSGEDSIFLDAGSGLINAPTEFPKPPLILISHLHLDHLLGLGMYPRLVAPGARTDVMLPAKDAREAAAMIDGLYAPPYWPVSLKQYRGDVHIDALRLPLQRGSLTVEGVAGSHPGDCMIFKLRCGEKSLVYATDFEPDAESFARLAAFARGTDLLLYDGQYTEEEYGKRKGFGHSTAEKGSELMTRCGVKRMLLIHHAPESSDEELLKREAELGRDDVRFAREGDVIVL